jgi:hypothetical protein
MALMLLRRRHNIQMEPTRSMTGAIVSPKRAAHLERYASKGTSDDAQTAASVI